MLCWLFYDHNVSNFSLLRMLLQEHLVVLRSGELKASSGLQGCGGMEGAGL